MGSIAMKLIMAEISSCRTDIVEIGSIRISW